MVHTVRQIVPGHVSAPQYCDGFVWGRDKLATNAAGMLAAVFTAWDCFMRLPGSRRAKGVTHDRERPRSSVRSPYTCPRTAAQWTDWDRNVVLSVAVAIDADRERVLDWFTHDRIREFGNRTAQQLVMAGETARVLDMLQAIRRGLRDR